MNLQRALAKAEMTAACFGLGGPLDVVRPSRSANDFSTHYPRAASALVELALTCPGLYYFATSWLPDTEYYRHQLLDILRYGARIHNYSLIPKQTLRTAMGNAHRIESIEGLAQDDTELA